jgi:hypothetical protein
MSSDRSCCHWRRIKCDITSKRVIGISLSLESIRPPDPLPQLNLTFFYPFEELQSLNLSSGYFKGWFDERKGGKGLGSLRNLETLDLGVNFYDTSVLPYLNEAVSLKTLILHDNLFKGGFPVQGRYSRTNQTIYMSLTLKVFFTLFLISLTLAQN